MNSYKHVAVTLAAVLMIPALSAAQTAAPVTAGWQDGFFVQSSDGANRLLFGFIGQLDGRFSVDDPLPITNTFTLRKARPTFSGRVARYFDFKFMPDFGNGTTAILDAYFDIRFSPKFRVRSGKDKTPVGYELLIGDAFLLFPERSLASSLVPNRDLGVAAQGDLSPKFYYAAGVFNGINDGASSTTDVDTNNGKDLAGRIVVQPFRSAQPSAQPLAGLGFQIGGSTGKQTGSLPAFRTSVGQTYFSYAAGATADGARARVTPAVFYYYKALGAFGEYVQSTQNVARTGRTHEFTNTAWNATASFLLTGEPASTGITRPRAPFDPAEGTWGAVQIVARYSALNLDDDIFSAGFAGPGASSAAKQFTIGANWYPASVFKYYLTYEKTTFEASAGTPRPTENIILFRVQLGI